MVTARPRSGLRRLYRDATIEALRRGDRRVGSEHIALALIADPESIGARALGVSLDTARGALQALDRQALRCVGIDATGDHPAPSGRRAGRLRLTPSAREVLTGLRRQTAGERVGERQALLWLLDRRPPDPAADLLDTLGVDRGLVRDRLARTDR